MRERGERGGERLVEGAGEGKGQEEEQRGVNNRRKGEQNPSREKRVKVKSKVVRPPVEKRRKDLGRRKRKSDGGGKGKKKRTSRNPKGRNDLNEPIRALRSLENQKKFKNRKRHNAFKRGGGEGRKKS